MNRGLLRVLAVSCVLVATWTVGTTQAWAKLPPPGRCPDASGEPGGEARGQDQGGPQLEVGQRLGLDDLLRLRSLLPEEIWDHREVFFFEGMNMELGACHRRYPPSDFFVEATERFRGQTRLDKKGNLDGYVAGLPFHPDDIDPEEEHAALRWAWNFEHRYRGAGPSGTFRIFDLPGRIGKPMVYEGSFFLLRTGHRADLEASDYRVSESKRTLWVGGGEFEEPFSARHLAWRQIRGRDTAKNWKKPDTTFVYVPTMRKPRRAASAWVDGVYTPRYRVSGDDGGGPLPFATNPGEFGTGIDSIQPTAGLSIAATEDIRRGFTGLQIRPNAYDWTLVGEREVLAPLNGYRQGWPTFADRNYGPSGLSVASDRWDVRWAVVIEGRARRIVDDVGVVQLWIDYQTQQPLYMINRRKNGFLLDIGILVHRFSGDQPQYPFYPGGEAANVFDTTAAVFYWVPGGGGGWRRESFDVKSLPLDPKKIRKYTTTDELMKGK